MPKEVLFGIHIFENGEIYFSMNDKNWFDKLFINNTYGVTVDIISKDRYDCGKNAKYSTNVPKGFMLPGVFKQDLINNSAAQEQGMIYTRIGNIPASMAGKEIEGNLVILAGTYICYYANFVNIDRSVWQLLKMGLYTDSLINEYTDSSMANAGFFTYSNKIQVEIPFLKGSSTFDFAYLKKYFDAVDLSASEIRKVSIRAYSSVEGTEKVNKELMAKRAESMITGLKKYQKSLNRIDILTAENWLDFYRDVKGTEFDSLTSLSKPEIRQLLTDPKVTSKLEPILAKHRKVIATLYLDNKSQAGGIGDSSLAYEFRKAIAAKETARARMLQKEIANRIMDHRLPLSFIDKLEVPQSRDFSSILNDREVYRYILKVTNEYQALVNFLEIQKTDPDNGRINYNICALRFFMWQFGGDTLSRKVLLNDINKLPDQGIPVLLVKRMLINYYLLQSEDQMRVFDYSGKDQSISQIRKLYENVSVSDEDIYSLAKYYSFYSQRDWALEIIEPRISSVNVNEDLLFYYLNLLFFEPEMYAAEKFRKASLNAVNLNNTRFCDFFKPIDKGGASMQLLDFNEIKKLYCTECR